MRPLSLPLFICCSFAFGLLVFVGFFEPPSAMAQENRQASYSTHLAEFALDMGDFAPAFALRAYNEDICLKTVKSPMLSLHEVTGWGAEHPHKAVLVSFMRVTSDSSSEALSQLQKLYEKFKDEGLLVVAVSVDQTEMRTIYKFLERQKVTYPILRDRFQIVAHRYGVDRFPTMFLVDDEGKIDTIEQPQARGLGKAMSRDIMRLLSNR